MHVALVMVASIDGHITRGTENNSGAWASKEDQAHFAQMKDQFPVIIMGSSTYQAAKGFLQLSLSTLRIVMTRRPEKFAGEVVANQLEFSSNTPGKVLQGLAARGVEKVLLVGGSHLNGDFFAGGLVDELQLTIEPWLFGEGLSLVSEKELNTKLRLESIQQLNTAGTLLIKYSVEK